MVIVSLIRKDKFNLDEILLSQNITLMDMSVLYNSSPSLYGCIDLYKSCVVAIRELSNSLPHPVVADFLVCLDNKKDVTPFIEKFYQLSNFFSFDSRLRDSFLCCAMFCSNIKSLSIPIILTVAENCVSMQKDNDTHDFLRRLFIRK
ncbi:hypothetical protein M0R04_05830 [Candidatus Dojkabacteria bacterium]|nr:hypothetical protein [Candidatus Dojkabacteria bacterium]